jgi:N-acyl-D-amino-acid deacylase
VADIGLVGDPEVSVGTIEGDARTVVDGSGKVVAPGFLPSPPTMTPRCSGTRWSRRRCSTGVTTALAGNCRFSIAPLSGRPEDAGYLMSVLVRAEAVPVDSLP